MIHMDKMKGVHGIVRVNFCETKQNTLNSWKFSDTKISWYTIVFRSLQFDSLFLTHTPTPAILFYYYSCFNGSSLSKHHTMEKHLFITSVLSMYMYIT